jgi:hypothetical protein
MGKGERGSVGRSPSERRILSFRRVLNERGCHIRRAISMPVIGPLRSRVGVLLYSHARLARGAFLVTLRPLSRSIAYEEHCRRP